MKKLSERMDAAQAVIDSERVRWLLGKKLTITKAGNVFGKQVAEGRYDLILSNAAESEFTRRLILEEIRVEARSAVEVATALNMKPAEVLVHFIAMRKWRLAEDVGEKDGYLVFRAVAPAGAEGDAGG